MNDCTRSLLATIVWFDMFDYPLTAWEAGKWRLCIHGRSRKFPALSDDEYLTILEALESLVAQQRLEKKWSFFFLPGREEVVETRRARYLLARKKYALAQRVTRWFRYVPFVRLVAACNTLGYSNAGEESDIDLFIVTKPGKVWTVRGLCLLLLQIFHLRPTLVRFGAAREERKDKIDLSFFITQDSLDISTLALAHDGLFGTAHGIHDPYLMYWFTQLTPLWDHGGVYQKLWDANTLVRAPLPHAAPYGTSSLRMVVSGWSACRVHLLFEHMVSGAWIESVSRLWQMNKIPARTKALTDSAGAVVLRNSVLKFHDIDRRAAYRTRWIEKLKLHGILS